MPGRTAVVIEAVRAAVADWRELVRVSRPRSWAVAAVPFAVGALDADRAISPLVVLGLVFFLGPFQLLHHGLSVVHEPGADPDRPAAMAIRAGIALVGLPLLAVLVLAGGAAAATAFLAIVVLAVLDVSPPARLATRPGIDLLVAGLLLMLPAVAGSLLGGRTPGELPWAALLALGSWGAGTAALAAVHDDPPTTGATGTVVALGITSTALVAFAAYVLAVLLTATLGALGLLAAIAVALFLLPPATILVSGGRRWRVAVPASGASIHVAVDADPSPAPTPNHDPSVGALESTIAAVADVARAAEQARIAAAAQRAWADLAGLVVLVGAWLAVLFLWDWSIVTFTPWMVAIGVPTVVAGYGLLNTLATRIATRRRRVSIVLHRPGSPVPPLTVIVPSRDDIATLPANLAALRAQTYPDVTLLVVDDASTDGSREEAAAWVGEDAVLSAPPRPAGWSSHAWACHIGANAATGDLILFVEPDTVLAPIGARVLVEQLMARGDDLLVGSTRDAVPTVGERAAVPGFALVRDAFAPTWWAAVTGGRPAWLVVPDGPLMLTRRDAYLATDGHRPVSSGPPNRGLTHAFARAGRRVGVVRMARLAAARRYRDVDAVVAGWRGRIIADGRGRLAGGIAIVALTATAFLAPMVVPAAAILAREDRVIVAAAFIPFAVLVATRTLISVVERHPATTILWHPVTVLVTLGAQVAGIADHVLGRGSPGLDPARAPRPDEGPSPAGS